MEDTYTTTGTVSAIGPDYTEQLEGIVKALKEQKTYLSDKDLFFRECMLRLFCNLEFDHNAKNARLLIKDCISRSKMFTNEVFNTRI